MINSIIVREKEKYLSGSVIKVVTGCYGIDDDSVFKK